MEGVFHERKNPKFFYSMLPVDTRVLDQPDDNDKCSSTVVPLEIDFKVSVRKRLCETWIEEGRSGLTLPVLARRTKSVIGDIRWLATKPVEVTCQISRVLSLMGIEEDRWDKIVDEIIDAGRRIGDSDSNNGPKVLRMRVRIRRVSLWRRCEGCTKELKRDTLIKKVLKRVRVVGDEDDEECNDSDEEDGRKRKRRWVVRESEVCPICIEEFVLGSHGVSCMPCSHVFHGKCMVQWLKRSHLKCPICRSEMPIELGSQACSIRGHPVFNRQCHGKGNMIRG